MTTKVAKKKFSQAQRDKLVIRQAKAVLAHRKAKQVKEEANMTGRINPKCILRANLVLEV